MPNPPKLPVSILNNNPGALVEAHGPWLKTTRFQGLAVFPTMHDGLLSLWHRLDTLYRFHGARTPVRLVARYDFVRDFQRWMLVDALCHELGIAPDRAQTEDLRLSAHGRMLATMRVFIRWCSGTPAFYRLKGDDWCMDAMLIGAIRHGMTERLSALTARSSQATRYRWNCSHLRPDRQSSSETQTVQSSGVAYCADTKN